jgi:hypothetical protein
MQGYIVQTAIKIINSRIETDANNCQISKSIIIVLYACNLKCQTKNHRCTKTWTVQPLVNGILIGFPNAR